jgi:hypothetical protein
VTVCGIRGGVWSILREKEYGVGWRRVDLGEDMKRGGTKLRRRGYESQVKQFACYVGHHSAEY